jgi:hypothetical protein
MRKINRKIKQRRIKGLGARAVDCEMCKYGVSYSIFKQDAEGNMETYLQCGMCGFLVEADKDQIKTVKSQNEQGGYFADFIYKGEDRKRYGSKYLRDKDGNIIGEKDE